MHRDAFFNSPTRASAGPKIDRRLVRAPGTIRISCNGVPLGVREFVPRGDPAPLKIAGGKR